MSHEHFFPIDFKISAATQMGRKVTNCTSLEWNRQCISSHLPPHSHQWYLEVFFFVHILISVSCCLPHVPAALWKWQPNTPNTSFSTSHLFGSPSPLLVPAMATSYQQRHTLHWFTSPTPNRHQPYTIPLSLLCDEAQLFHFLRILWRCLALEQGRLETWVLSGIW